MRKYYEPDAEHVIVPTLPYSEHIWREDMQSQMSLPGSKNSPEDRARSLEENYRAEYREDAPLKEYNGYVWRISDAESADLWVDVPKIMVRVWSRASFSAARAVSEHFGDEYGKSLQNEEESQIIR